RRAGRTAPSNRKMPESSSWTSPRRENAGPTENVRGALALGDAGASCPSNPAGPLGGPGRKTKRPAATIAGAGFATALAAFIKRPQAEAQIGAAITNTQRQARSQPNMLWDGLFKPGGRRCIAAS